MSHTADRDLQRRLRELGFTLLRQRKHLIWEHQPTGVRLVTACSCSDHRAYQNALATARRLLRQAGVRV